MKTKNISQSILSIELATKQAKKRNSMKQKFKQIHKLK